MTNPTSPLSPEAVAQMVADLTTKAAMSNMGEKIAWGSDSGVMDAAADMLTTLAAENATLRASEAAALERVMVLTEVGNILAANASRFHSALWSDAINPIEGN